MVGPGGVNVPGNHDFSTGQVCGGGGGVDRQRWERWTMGMEERNGREEDERGRGTREKEKFRMGRLDLS